MIIIFNNYNFARNIRCLRERKGMTREELAQESGMELEVLEALEEEQLLEFESRDFSGVCRALGEEVENIVHKDLT